MAELPETLAFALDAALLAPLMFVAAKENRSMADVARLVTGGDEVE